MIGKRHAIVAMIVPDRAVQLPFPHILAALTPAAPAVGEAIVCEPWRATFSDQPTLFAVEKGSLGKDFAHDIERRPTHPWIALSADCQRSLLPIFRTLRDPICRFTILADQVFRSSNIDIFRDQFAVDGQDVVANPQSGPAKTAVPVDPANMKHALPIDVLKSSRYAATQILIVTLNMLNCSHFQLQNFGCQQLRGLGHTYWTAGLNQSQRGIPTVA
ncbi:MAG: hypothetical protein HC869_00030 [Rhodospirillales bacterium]|nr:hypothetical protein [Rhodospirillales bacterium]